MSNVLVVYGIVLNVGVLFLAWPVVQFLLQKEYMLGLCGTGFLLLFFFAIITAMLAKQGTTLRQKSG